jgi:hypothetical protein
MVPAACTERIAALLGPPGYLDQPEDLALYEYDGGVENIGRTWWCFRAPPKMSPPS